MKTGQKPHSAFAKIVLRIQYIQQSCTLYTVLRDQIWPQEKKTNKDVKLLSKLEEELLLTMGVMQMAYFCV